MAKVFSMVAPPLMLSMLVFCLISSSFAAAPKSWSIPVKQSAKSLGTATHPAIRYGHTAVSYKDSMIVTHGYFYDREGSQPMWLSDTWQYSSVSKKWARLSPGIHQDDAHEAYRNGQYPAVPCGRFGHASAIHNDILYLHGGHDGGYSRHNRQNYELGYDFDELWGFSLTTKKWSLITPSSSESPGARYLHGAAVVDDNIVIYGGLAATQGDVWSYSIKDNAWTKLSSEIPVSLGGPGRRIGVQLLPFKSPQVTGVLVFGGRDTPESDDVRSQVRNDVWLFNINTRTWSQLRAVGDVAPPGRHYYRATQVQLKADKTSNVTYYIISGGSITTPGLACTNSTWMFSLDCQGMHVHWKPLPDMPFGVYDHSIVAVGTSLLTFGGHLCTETMGSHPFYYMNAVAQYDMANVHPEYGCGLKR